MLPRLLQFEIGRQIQFVDVDRLGAHIERIGPIRFSHDDCDRLQASCDELPAARSVDLKLPGFHYSYVDHWIGEYGRRAQAGHVLPGCPHEHNASPDRRRKQESEREDHELQRNHPYRPAAVHFECRIEEIGHDRNPDITDAREHS